MPPVFAVVFRRPQLDDGPMIDSTQPNAGAVLGRPTTNPAEGGHPAPARCRAVVLACVDSDAVEPLRSLLSRVDYRGAVLSAGRWPGGRRALTELALGATTPVLIAGRPVRPGSVQPSAAPATTHKLVHTPGSHR